MPVSAENALGPTAFAMGVVSTFAGLYPYLHSPGIAYHQAVNGDARRMFLPMGARAFLPIIVETFRPKMRPGEGHP